jgi:hypothetical protein
MKKTVLILVGILVSHVVLAETIHTVKIWHDSKLAPVMKDYRFSQDIELDVFDLGIKKEADQKINEALQARGLSYTENSEQNMTVVTEALHAFLETDAYKEIEKEFKYLGVALQFAMEYRIEKVPAIVFNDRYTVLGISSLAEAVSIYEAKVGK